MIKEVILAIISGIVQLIIYYTCFMIFVKKFAPAYVIRKNKIITFLAFIVICSVLIVIRLFCNNLRFLNILFFVICIFILSKLLFKLSTLNTLWVCFAPFLLMFISEIISVFAIRMVLSKTAEDLVNSLFLSYLVILVESIIVVLLLFVLKKLLNSTIMNTKMLINKSFKYIILFLICVVPQLILFYFYKYDYPISILIINSLQLILICAVLLSYFKITAEKEKAESDLEISELHNKTMVNMVDGVRTLKHDYNNIMQALNGYLSTKQYDKLQEHINKVLDECNIVNNLSVIDQKVFNDPAIYGIVGAKYFIAIESDIKFEFDIVTNIQEINFSMPELSRILGIILDNAIEATLKCDNKYIKLEMKYDSRKNADIIKVYNTYDKNITIDLKGIYEKGVSSKEVKSGIGLWEVKKLINKSKNSQIYATIEQDMFVQNIIIEKTS